MPLQIVGAGLGRTGTHSLKLALEQLLGAPCYHMMEVFGRPDDVAVWADAYRGRDVDWDALFVDYAAAVDWPPAGCWRQIAAAFPDAPVLLSERDADSWWASASATIFNAMDRPPPGAAEGWSDMAGAMLESFCPDWQDETAAKAAFRAHNAEVRDTVAPDRLIVWQPGDGWGPICTGLGLDEPAEPYPHVNTTAEFRAMSGLDS
jgi:hypothetical protein